MFYPSTCVGLRYGPQMDMLSGFSRKYGYPRCRRLPEEEAYCRLSAQRVDLPALLSTYGLQRPFFRQGAVVSLLRLHVAPAEGHGILTVSAIGLAVRLSLRTRLTRADWHRPGNLRLAAGAVLTPLVVTYAYICFSTPSRNPHGNHSTEVECSPTGTFHYSATPCLRYLT